MLPDQSGHSYIVVNFSCLNAPDGAGCFPTPRRVVRCPAWRNGPRIATGPKAPLGPGRTPLIKPGFAQFSQGSPPTGLQGLRATRCRRGHADPGDRAVFFRYQYADVGREPGSPGSQTAGGMRSCGGRGASSNEGGSGIPALVCPAGAHRGDAVVGVVPCPRPCPGCWGLGPCS